MEKSPSPWMFTETKQRCELLRHSPPSCHSRPTASSKQLRLPGTESPTSFHPVLNQNEHVPFASILSTCPLNPLHGGAQPKQLSQCHLAPPHEHGLRCKAGVSPKRMVYASFIQRLVWFGKQHESLQHLCGSPYLIPLNVGGHRKPAVSFLKKSLRLLQNLVQESERRL